MGNVLGIMLYVLMFVELFVSAVWIIFTKKALQKTGVPQFLIATIAWNGVLFGVYILIWKMSSLSVIFYTSMPGWLGSLCNIIYSAYYMLMLYAFPTYTLLIMMYVGYYHIKSKRNS